MFFLPKEESAEESSGVIYDHFIDDSIGLTSKEQLDSVKASLKTVTHENLLQDKTERASQSGCETHLRLEEKDEDYEEEEESIYMSAKTNNSHTNKRKLVLDLYEKGDCGFRVKNGMTYEEDTSSLSCELSLNSYEEDDNCMRRLSYETEYGENISSYEAKNLANNLKNSLGSKSKIRNTSIVNNHSMQTGTFRSRNISIQTEIEQRTSIGTEVFL
jgi:hypothetical protein